MGPSATAGPAALLEREHEVERVHAVLRAIGQHRGGVLVIEGAAGLGKSRSRRLDLPAAESAFPARSLGPGVPDPGHSRVLGEAGLIESGRDLGTDARVLIHAECQPPPGPGRPDADAADRR